MSFWLIALGLLLVLIGFSVWYDDKEFNRLLELDEMEKEGSPELYDDEEDKEFHDRWGALAPYVAYTVVAFYALRGILTGLGGVWLVVLGVG